MKFGLLSYVIERFSGLSSWNSGDTLPGILSGENNDGKLPANQIPADKT